MRSVQNKPSSTEKENHRGNRLIEHGGGMESIQES